MAEVNEDELTEHFSGRRKGFKILNVVLGGALVGTLLVGGVSMARYYLQPYERYTVEASDFKVQPSTEIEAAELVAQVMPAGFEWTEGYRLCPYDDGRHAPKFVKNIADKAVTIPYSDNANALILRAKVGKDVVLYAMRAEVDFCDLDTNAKNSFRADTLVSVRSENSAKLIVDFEK
ncbi:hypothetical protein [Gleimia coleocanis]|nr:hypothetical protein [Gleimia coleocanis]